MGRSGSERRPLPGLDERKRSDLRGGINARALSYESRWMSAGAGRGDWVEQPSNARPSRIGRLCDDRYGSGWHPCEHVRMHDHCPSRGLLQCLGIAPVVQEAHFISIRRFQRGDAHEQQINLRCGTGCGSSDRRERVRSASGKEARIANWGPGQVQRSSTVNQPCVRLGCKRHNALSVVGNVHIYCKLKACPPTGTSRSN